MDHDRQAVDQPVIGQERQSAFTPGPWRIYDASDPFAIKILGVSSVYGNAHVATALSEANARLISAAPDMLAALKAIVWEATPDARARAGEAIAKAEGR